MFIAVALSRAYRLTTEDAKQESSEVHALPQVQKEDGLPTRLQEFKRVTECDPVMQLLIIAIRKGWPLSRKGCLAKLVPYYDSRSGLVEDSGLVYRGQRLVVPCLLRADMPKEIHRSHIGIGGYLRRARELYWPRINAEVRDDVSKSRVCQTYTSPSNAEKNSSHMKCQAAQFLESTSTNVIHAFKIQFARHGIPEVLVTDNGTQFS
ncbi:PREDICTED: uncharacterized protein LOC107345002 [Acropora digitifera]|uniref:uncharacterized protein LOC107345002 n=1 Tax=Acropora digitifera TaxID=70779 RepID=UPI00077B1392|nr:PREDICTED: uncharacterized protein LOC107345002 [Acropora digitifera]